MATATDSTGKRSDLRVAAIVLGLLATILIPINIAVFASMTRGSIELFTVLGIVQLVVGTLSATLAAIEARRKQPGGARLGMILWAIFAGLVGLGGPVGVALGWWVMIGIALGSGGAWGRPLRVRGRQLHPELKDGADWTRGARPSAAGLDAKTRTALEALWLHDAQKEHASVPAFSRVSWMLASIGAPAELLAMAHRAAIEEIDHAERCFALAAGYGGRTHTVEGMPDLLLGGLDVDGDARVAIAIESLKDGCLLEDFNADVAAVCAQVCREPITRSVLEQIAREERSHARFSWDVLEWTLARWPREIAPAVRTAMLGFDRIARPTAASAEKAALVAAADPIKLREHGRITDEEWGALWDARVIATRERASALLARLESSKPAPPRLPASAFG
jgi:hypothetical protein